MLLISFFAEQVPTSIVMWLISFFLLNKSLKIEKQNAFTHIACISIVAAIGGIFKNYIVVGSSSAILIYIGLVPILSSLLVLIVLANSKKDASDAKNYTPIQILGGVVLLVFIFAIFSSNKSESVSSSYENSSSVTKAPSTSTSSINPFSKQTYTVYGCSNSKATSEADCGERVARTTVEYIVEKNNNAVFAKGVALKDGSKFIKKLDDCTIIDDKNWTCGGKQKWENGEVAVDGVYQMVDGDVTYKNGYFSFKKADGTKGFYSPTVSAKIVKN